MRENSTECPARCSILSALLSVPFLTRTRRASGCHILSRSRKRVFSSSEPVQSSTIGTRCYLFFARTHSVRPGTRRLGERSSFQSLKNLALLSSSPGPSRLSTLTPAVVSAMDDISIFAVLQLLDNMLALSLWFLLHVQPIAVRFATSQTCISISSGSIFKVKFCFGFWPSGFVSLLHSMFDMQFWHQRL